MNDLGTFRVTLSTMSEQLHKFMSERKPSLETDVKTGHYCKTKVVTVQLLCDCFCPWIEGSTSVAIYGKQQKEFNMHLCCKCQNWYHSYCLKKVGISPPNRRAQFICHHCTVPMTLKWGAKNFTNTCTLDNFLTTLLLYCKQHPDFLIKAIGNSDSEDVLKTGMKLMLGGELVEGRNVILQHVNTKVKFRGNQHQYDCYGNEHSNFLSIFKNISKIIVVQQCTSHYCPMEREEVMRSIPTFSFQLPSNECFEDQLKHLFPVSGAQIKGYCSAEFKGELPLQSDEHILCDRLKEQDGDGLERELYYVCGAKPRVLEASFLSRNPWMIPINISQFCGTETQLIPHEFIAYSLKFKLAGYSLHTPGHFTSIIMWKDKLYYYDDLKGTKEQRLRLLRDEDVVGKSGSYAYYFSC